MNWRAFLGTLIALLVLMMLVVQGAKAIWPAPIPMPIDGAVAHVAQFKPKSELLAPPLVAEPARIEIPIDVPARAKFPREQPEEIDALAMINRLVNGAIRPMSDKAQYGRQELWVMLPESMAGDCEDYVLSKLAILGDAGFQTVSNARIRAVVVHRKGKKPDGHAILELLLPKGSIVFLDNNFDGLMTRKELVAAGYVFFDW